MKRIASLGLIAATVFTSAGVVFAADEKTNDTVVMSVGNERYIAGENVTIAETIPGDLTVASGNVTVNSIVNGSLQAMGGNVTLTNLVRGNARIAGGTVVISKNINGNLVVAGGTVHIEPTSTIGGSVLVFGGSVIVDGAINGTLKVRGGKVTLNGSVRGDADLQTETLAMNGRITGNAIVSAKTLSLGQGASFQRNLNYWTLAGEQDFKTVVRGKATYDTTLAMHDSEMKDGKTIIAALIAAVSLFSLLSGALVILVMQLLTKNFFKDSAKMLHSRPGKSLLTGLLYFLLAPLAALLLIITIIGIPLGIAVALGLVLSIIFAKACTAIVLARWLEVEFKKKWSSIAIFFISLLIFVLLKLIDVIPVIGWLATLAAVLFCFGALIITKYERYLKVR